MRKAFVFMLCIIGSHLVAEQTPPQSLYDISVKSLEGQSIPLSAFRGRVLFIVNTASRDRNSNQMDMLEALYQKYKEPGFVVLAFPSNDFMSEEPGPSTEVRTAYQEKFKVTFPVLEKVHVTGPDKSPIYAFLTNTKTDHNYGWEIDWSFTKFLIDRRGNVINRFSTTTEPSDPRVIQAIERALAEK